MAVSALTRDPPSPPQVQDVPGLVERLLGFLDIGKDFVTAETIVQVKDLARKYPDIAEVCVGSISSISLEVHLPVSLLTQCVTARSHVQSLCVVTRSGCFCPGFALTCRLLCRLQ